MTTGWLLRGKDNRLTAYAPTADGVLRWTETLPGGPGWTGPELLPHPGLLPHLAFAQTAEGYVHLLGLRDRPRAGGPKNREVVHAVQFQTGRALRDWQPLGTPHTKDVNAASRTGRPSAVVDARGAVHLFVRNGNGHLSYRSQSPTGRWLGWGGVTPEGGKITGEMGAAVTDDGRIEILGPADGLMTHWARPKPDAQPERAEEGEEPAASAEETTGLCTGPGRVTHFWRDTGTRTLRAWRPGTAPTDLGGPGSGLPALLRTPVGGLDCTILAARGPDGRPQVAAYPTETEEAGLNWTPTGEPCTGVPALATDGRGRVVLAVVGEDGALRVTRQKDEPGLALEAWSRV
ncbi:hypothetical protein [Streptomyces liangshanensis]|uniref:Uncharacterized protein n=1 Tax=Streptomyces liangshanensis TaxID=2717324 RepID=A0A6G9GUY5_9ACTN|nr:hypothetical protein [Streptomyces liangshanensis]QIQ02083.1 hypothetical protein HA039_07010 [Streptomyces liangshanensis]